MAMEMLVAAVERLRLVCPWTAAQKSDNMIHFVRKEILELEEVFLASRHSPLHTANLTQELGDVLFDVLLLIQEANVGIPLMLCTIHSIDEVVGGCEACWNSPTFRA